MDRGPGERLNSRHLRSEAGLWKKWHRESLAGAKDRNKVSYLIT